MMAEETLAGIGDGLQNVITGLGTDRDKVMGNRHHYVPLTYGQLRAAYRGSWAHRKVVDIPADDATRNWRTWQGDPAQVRAVERLEERLQVRSRVNETIRNARLYGGAAIMLVFNDGVDPVTPLEKVDQGSLVKVHSIESTYLKATDYFDVTVGPEYYRLYSGVPIHTSRLARVIPRPIPDSYNREEWGDSVLQTCMMEANNLLSVEQSLAHMISEAKVDVIKIKDLISMLGNADFEQILVKRLTMVNHMKSLVNAQVLDAEDEWEQKRTDFANIPSAADTFMQLMASAADIPMTRFTSQSPGGLNATGDSDIRNYYDSIRADQNNTYTDALLPMDRALVHSALGEWPAGLTYRWDSLWQETPDALAARALQYSTIFSADVASGVFSDEELRGMRIAQLQELGVYPNVEAATGTETDIEEEIDEDDDDVRNTFNALRDIPSYDPAYGAGSRARRTV